MYKCKICGCNFDYPYYRDICPDCSLSNELDYTIPVKYKKAFKIKVAKLNVERYIPESF